MEMPVFLPERLMEYSTAADDAVLFAALIKKQADFLEFFEYAANHETWSEDHPEFMRSALDWVTHHFLQNRLTSEAAQKIAEKIRLHFPILSIYVPNNIVFDVEGVSFSVNSLMFGTASPMIHELILREYRDKGQETVKLKNITPLGFRAIQEYVMTGTVLNLWKEQEAELMQIHAQASYWGFYGLACACEKILSRYIMRGNVIEKLIEAHENQWLIVQESCCQFMNQLDLGYRVQAPAKALSFEFFAFVGSALDAFEKLRRHITHLIFRKNLIEDFTFRDVVNQCPHLTGLDIDDSNSYDENLQSVPTSIQELDISSCSWLRPEHFPLLAKAFPNLRKLVIRNNIRLDYNSWSQLTLFPLLIDLDISLNTQITDSDFKIILQALPGLTDLKADACIHISDRGFLDMMHSEPQLVVLSVERTDISDGTLADLAERCLYLKDLNIARCSKITDKGVWDLVRISNSLYILNLAQCAVSEATIQQIKTLKPYLILRT